MKNNILKIFIITILVFLSSFSYAQTQTNKLITEIDYIIGDYGISFKNKKIGRLQYYDCSENERECAECYGYFEISKINFDTTNLFIVGKSVLFLESVLFDVNSLQVIENKISWKESKKRDGLYHDKNGVYRNLFTQKKFQDLKGYAHLESHFFTKNNELYFADIHGFYKIDKSNQLDFDSIKLIKGNFFMDKNGYYFADTYSIANEEKFDLIDFIKIQDKITNPEIRINDNYCVINKKVYALNSNLKELELEYNNIQKLDIFKFDGAIALSDNKNTYYRYRSNYSFDKVDCDEDKNELYCIEKYFSKIKLLRETGFTEYYYDIDNKILYFDTNDLDMKFTRTSGDIYKISNGYYLNDHDRFSEIIKEVKIWNPKIKAYENLENDYYQHIYRVMYFYKGNVYGHHSKLIQNNFNIKALKVLETHDHYYIADDKILIDFSESQKLNLNKLEVLKMTDGEPSNYLTDGDSLIYNNKLIENFNNEDVKVVNKDLLITKKNIYSKEEVIVKKEFGIPIKFLDQK